MPVVFRSDAIIITSNLAATDLVVKGVAIDRGPIYIFGFQIVLRYTVPEHTKSQHLAIFVHLFMCSVGLKLLLLRFHPTQNVITKPLHRKN